MSCVEELIPPPMVPGMHERNSNPDNEFSNANLERFLSKVDDPAIILFLLSKEI